MTIQTSTIDSTKPIAVTPTTQSVRDNFAAAAAEINQCFINDDTLKARVLTVESLPAPFAINAVRASHSLPQAFLLGVPKQIEYSTLDSGDPAIYNAATSAYTCQEAGIYVVSFAYILATLDKANTSTIFIRKNGVNFLPVESITSSGVPTWPTARTIYVPAAAGDILTVWQAMKADAQMKTIGTDPWALRNNITFLRVA